MQSKYKMPQRNKTNDERDDYRIADPHSPEIEARLYLEVLSANGAPVRHIKHAFE